MDHRPEFGPHARTRAQGRRGRVLRLAGTAAAAALLLGPLGAVLAGGATAGASASSSTKGAQIVLPHFLKAPGARSHALHGALHGAKSAAAAPDIASLSTPSKAQSDLKAVLSQHSAAGQPKHQKTTGYKAIADTLPAAVTPTVTYTVDTTADTIPTTSTTAASDCAVAGTCSLRRAVEAAGGASGPALVLVPKGVYVLSYGSLELSNPAGMEVEGETGAAETVIYGANTDTFYASPLPGTVSSPRVTLTTHTAGASASYAIRFVTSTAGALPTGGTITVTAPSGTEFPATTTAYSVAALSQGPRATLTVTGVTLSATDSTATITIAGDPGSAVSLDVTIGNVTNPVAAPADTLTVATSVDTSAATSNPYSIQSATQATAVTVPVFSALTYDATHTNDYRVEFGTHGSTPVTQVVITTAPGTTLPSDAGDYTYCTGTACTPSTVVNNAVVTSNTVTLTLTSVAAGTSITIEISGATNPSATSVNDTISVTASTRATAAESAPFEVVGNDAYFPIVYLTTDTEDNLTTLSGLTIEDGLGTSTAAGGVNSETGGMLEVDTSTVVDNGGQLGGGLFAEGDAGTFLTDDLFQGNGGEYGGGVDIPAPAYVNDISLNWNQAGEGGGAWFGFQVIGSGISATDDDATEGGGIFSTGLPYTPYDRGGCTLICTDEYDSFADVTLTTVHVTDSGAFDGGGVFANDQTAHWTGLVLTTDGAELGGGMMDLSSSAYVDNATFSGDEAEFMGGGLLGFESNLTMIGATADTDQAELGGGMFLSNGHLTSGGSTYLEDVTTDDDFAEIGGGINDYPMYLYSVYRFIDGIEDDCEDYTACPTLTTVAGTLTDIDGSASTDAAYLGGGIYNSETLTLTGTSVDGDEAAAGGGIYEAYNGSDTDHTLFTARATLTTTGGSVSGDETVCSDEAHGTCDFFLVAHGARATGHAGHSAAAAHAPDITCGIFCGDVTFGSGGGIFAGYYGTVQLHNTTFTGDSAETGGGAVAIRWASTDTNTGGSFTGDSADWGGAWAIGYGANLTLYGATVATDSAYYDGGGVANTGTVTISHDTLTGDTVTGTITGCTTTTYKCPVGGAVSNYDAASINNSVISDSSSTGLGGGIENGFGYDDDAQMSISDSTIAGNSAFIGGGIFSTTTLHVTGSTLSGNFATADGAGLFEYTGGALFTNSTVEGNTVADGNGAGIFNESRLGLVEVTVADNTVTSLAPRTTTGTMVTSVGGAGVASGGPIDVAYSILAGNTSTGASQNCVTEGPIGSGGYNVASDTTCDLTAVGDQNGVTPKLGPLGSYGGTTETMPIGATSPALNVRSSDCPTTTDQRGYPRPSTVEGAKGCDAGAYQLQPDGYWMVASDGGIFNYGTATFHGSEGGKPLNQPMVGMASDGYGGYWTVAADGGIFSFTAPFDGSLPLDTVSVDDIVGMAATPTGGGYWLVGSDGGIFAFGDAPYEGSIPGLTITVDNIVGISAMPTGNGYYLVGSDGGVFAFGTAKSHGSLPGLGVTPNKPVVGIAATPDGKGYWLVGADGGVYNFGDAGLYGSMGGKALNAPVVGMAAAPGGLGYWLVAADGGIFAFGSAQFLGSTGSMHLNKPVVGMAAAPVLT